MSEPDPSPSDLLGDADREVRLQAVQDIGGHGDPSTAAALVARFGPEQDFYIRETLTWAALRLAPASLPLIRAALAEASWTARLQAVHTLSKLADPQDTALLVPLVADPVDCVAARAYWAVSRCGGAEAVPALLSQLSRGDSEHRNSLTVALAEFGVAAVPGLRAALHHPRPEVRLHAADTLTVLGPPGAEHAVPELTGAVADPDPEVRAAALNALGHLLGDAAWEVVDRVAATADEQRLRVLATRLGERRPGELARRRAAQRSGPTPGAVPAVPAVGTWPQADPGLVTLAPGPWNDQLGPVLARQVEICRPQYLARGDVPADVIDTVRVRAWQRARAAGRPPVVAERIALGRVEQFLRERVLLDQLRVADAGGTVDDLLRGKDLRILDFVRLPPTPDED